MTRARLRRSYQRGHDGPKCVQCALELSRRKLATVPHDRPVLCVLHASRGSMLTLVWAVDRAGRA